MPPRSPDVPWHLKASTRGRRVGCFWPKRHVSDFGASGQDGTLRKRQAGSDALISIAMSPVESSVNADRSRPSLNGEDAGSARDAVQRVLQVITALLAEGGVASIAIVADRMETSVRTLQRRLHETGLTYSDVAQRVRHAAATRMLLDANAGINDVARALGYSDPAHFTRAFHRWTGCTPRDFRAKAAVVHKQKPSRRRTA